MSILICGQCANIRGMVMPPIQKTHSCDFCGKKALIAEFPITALNSPESGYSEKGYLNSNNIAKSIALMKSRKLLILPQIKHIEAEVSKTMVQTRYQETFYLVDVLVKEGLTKKSVNTARSVFERLEEILEKAQLSTPEVATKKLIRQNLMSELAALEEKERQLSVLYKNCLDQILINVLRGMVGAEKFSKAYTMAKGIYDKMQGRK